MDNTDLKFDDFPAPLKGNDRVTFIQLSCHEFEAFKFDSSLPIKVYLAFRSDQEVPEWVAEQFVPTALPVMVRSDHFHHAYILHESKGVYIPGVQPCRLHAGHALLCHCVACLLPQLPLLSCQHASVSQMPPRTTR